VIFQEAEKTRVTPPRPPCELCAIPSFESVVDVVSNDVTSVPGTANRSGTNISCAYFPTEERKIDRLQAEGFIADAVTHRLYCRSEREAHYLVGVLNSNVVNDAIKPYQTEGVYHGKRDIYRRPSRFVRFPNLTLRIQLIKKSQDWHPKQSG
jgi:hypothetical protein